MTAGVLPAALREGIYARSKKLLRTRFPSLSRGHSFDLTLAGLVGATALVLCLNHPWNHALIGEAQFGDAAYWDLGAESWARGYIATKEPDIRPGYSLFMGIVYALFGVDASRAFAAQSVLTAAGAVMLYVIGRRLGGRLAGILAASQFALNPYVWEWTAITTTDLVGSIANLVALFFLVSVLRGRGRLVGAALFGVFFAIANIVRVFTLPFIVPAVLLLLLVHASWRRRFALAGVALTAIVVTLLPGLIYQYRNTGDFGLSSNSASAIFAASSPKYRVWTPEMYDEIGQGMRARGIEVTPQNTEAEFRRLTLENYLNHPWFQIERLGAGFYGYAAFEGQTERPDKFVFFRRFILAVPFIALGVLALVAVAGLRRWAVAPALLGVAALIWAPLPALFAGQVVAAVGALFWLVRRRDSPALTAGAVALFWSVTGLGAIFSAGIVGALLFRLNLQVEPARALLLALAITYLVSLLVPNRIRRARLLQLAAVFRRTPHLPGAIRPALTAAAAAGALLFLVGGIRLAAANVLPRVDEGFFPPPSSSDLAVLAAELGLPQSLQYLDAEGFRATRATLDSPMTPKEPLAFAMPGQFTRFVWYIEDQDRTLSWYVSSDRPRPEALDRTLVLIEAGGRLPAAEFRDRPGLLVVAPTNPYFDASGDPSQFNLIPARAFVPWDSETRRFRADAATVFPLSTRLHGLDRLEGAEKTGQIQNVGSVRVSKDDRNLPAWSFQPTAASGNGELEAALTYSDLHIPTRGRFHAWLAVHPALFRHATIGKPRFEVRVNTGGRETTIGGRVFDPMNPAEDVYRPFDVDLSPYQGQRVDLTMRVLSDALETERAIVLVASPEIVMP